MRMVQASPKSYDRLVQVDVARRELEGTNYEKTQPGVCPRTFLKQILKMLRPEHLARCIDSV